MRHALLIALFALLAGCVSTTNSNYTQTIESWRGGNVKALFARWGTPTEQVPGPNGTVAYLYKTQSYPTMRTAGGPNIGVHYTGRSAPVITNTNPAVMNASNRGSISLNCTVIFVGNAQGQIIDTQIEGVGCYGGSNFSARMGNPSTVQTSGAPR